MVRRPSYQTQLLQIGRALNAATPEAALRELVHLVAEATQSKGCALMLLSPDRQRLAHTASWGLSRAYREKGTVLASPHLQELWDGRMETVQDIATDPRIQFPREAAAEGIAALVSVPLRLGDEPIGLLRLYSSGLPAEPTAGQRRFLQTVAELAVLGLENIRARDAQPAWQTAAQEDLLSWYATWERQHRNREEHQSFAHPSEEEFARILDFHRVRWLYEPRSFRLEWDERGVHEMFTPDFYLPDLDLFVELTTLRQRLVTAKNRKLRRLRELYPEVNVVLLYRKDYHRLLARFGVGPLGDAMGSPGRVLFDSVQIHRRVRQLGRRIAVDYAGQHPVLVGVLRGVMCFMADLIRQCPEPLEVDFMAISSYEGQDPGPVRIVKDLTRSIEGRHVLLVEDIVDTGMTLNHLLNHLRGHRPASVEVCALMDKRARRLADVPIRYVGFEVPDEFVVGYGLDYREEYRNLPFVAVLGTAAAAP